MPLPIQFFSISFFSGVVQTLTADLNIGLHINQPPADNQRRSTTI